MIPREKFRILVRTEPEDIHRTWRKEREKRLEAGEFSSAEEDRESCGPAADGERLDLRVSAMRQG